MGTTAKTATGSWVKLDGEWHIKTGLDVKPGDVVEVRKRSGESRMVQTSTHCDMATDDGKFRLLMEGPKASAPKAPTAKAPRPRLSTAQRVHMQLLRMDPHDRFDIFDGAFGIDANVPTLRELEELPEGDLKWIAGEIRAAR